MKLDDVTCTDSWRPQKLKNRGEVATLENIKKINKDFFVLSFTTEDKYLKIHDFWTNYKEDTHGSFSGLNFIEETDSGEIAGTKEYILPKSFDYCNIIPLKFYYEIHFYNLK
jgi:hypothetical protein